MEKQAKCEFQFSQIHIEIARNSTDDFNLFHDKDRWQQITANPFQGPIMLGFQLECLIENQLRCYREKANANLFIKENKLSYSNYQFSFANAVKPDQPVSLEVKKSIGHSEKEASLSNRVILKSGGSVALLGYKKETTSPLFATDIDLDKLPKLSKLEDRCFLSNRQYFLKRKYMNVANAKNFLLGSLVEQSNYFNEIEDTFTFPETFPLSLVSCALLERALKEGHDFTREPMVYTSHKFSVNRELNAALKSNDRLDILLSPLTTKRNENGKSNSCVQQICHCFGFVADNQLLFQGEIALASLPEILNRGVK